MKKKTSTWACLPAIGLVLCFSGHVDAALLFGTNLISNPGAEAGTGSVKNDTVVPVPSWTGTGGFTAVQYRPSCTGPGCLPGVPTVDDPGPLNRGNNLFAGGPITSETSTSVSLGDQIVDISNGAALIDTGTVPFTLSGYLGGYLDQRDNAMFSAIFLPGNSSASIGPVTLADRTNGTPFTGLLFRSTTGFVPSGTRQIDFHLTLNGIDGAQNDGYADNLSFVASDPTRTPEPASVGLMGAGLAALGIFAGRKKKS